VRKAAAGAGAVPAACPALLRARQLGRVRPAGEASPVDFTRRGPALSSL